jgi:hypothetical protein
MLQSGAESINSMYYHHANTQGQTNTPINIQYLPNSQFPPNVLGQPNMQYSPIIQGQPNMQNSSIIQTQPKITVNNIIPSYQNMYPSIGNQDQHFSHMLSNQIAPSVQAPMLPLQADKNRTGYLTTQ